MRILLVVAYFVPEIGSASHLYYDIARGLIEKGHEVSVLTSYPRSYNLTEQDKSNEYPLDEVIDEISVHRVRTEVNRDSSFKRGLEHYRMPQKFFKRFERMGEKVDVALIYIPPLPLYKLGLNLKANGIPSILHIQDFHPQELTDVGVLKNPLLIEFMKKEERKAYSTADQMIVLTKGAVEYVAQRGAKRERVTVIYNSYDDGNGNGTEHSGINQEGAKRKFSVTYAGIVSPFQGLDCLLDAAKLLDAKQFGVLIVGDGMYKSHLIRRRDSEKISNVSFLPFQGRMRYFDLISNSDINLVTLDERMKAPCLPGKIADLIKARRPIVFSVPRKSETGVIADNLGIGLITSNECPNELADSIVKLSLDSNMKKWIIDNQEKAFTNGIFNPNLNLTTLEGILRTIASCKNDENKVIT